LVTWVTRAPWSILCYEQKEQYVANGPCGRIACCGSHEFDPEHLSVVIGHASTFVGLYTRVQKQ
jgi:hypothetical protein